MDKQTTLKNGNCTQKANDRADAAVSILQTLCVLLRRLPPSPGESWRSSVDKILVLSLLWDYMQLVGLEGHREILLKQVLNEQVDHARTAELAMAEMESLLRKDRTQPDRKRNFIREYRQLLSEQERSNRTLVNDLLWEYPERDAQVSRLLGLTDMATMGYVDWAAYVEAVLLLLRISEAPRMRPAECHTDSGFPMAS